MRKNNTEFRGILNFNGFEMPCYIDGNGKRMIDCRGTCFDEKQEYEASEFIDICIKLVSMKKRDLKKECIDRADSVLKIIGKAGLIPLIDKITGYTERTTSGDNDLDRMMEKALNRGKPN